MFQRVTVIPVAHRISSVIPTPVSVNVSKMLKVEPVIIVNNITTVLILGMVVCHVTAMKLVLST